MDQRKAFEKWAKDSGYALLKTGLNQYFYGDTGAAWDAWQAACAQGGKAFILRKQAEAVEQARDEICNRAGSPSWHSIELTDYAQGLRQQAEAVEKGGDDE